jgi:hypothetical protein
MNDHSRSIDIRIHGIRQGYLDEAMRIGGVASTDSTSDILTKNLQPHLHQKHCTQLHITTHRKKYQATNNAIQCKQTLTLLAKQEPDPRLNHRNSPNVMQHFLRHSPSVIGKKHIPDQPKQPKVDQGDLPHRTIQRSSMNCCWAKKAKTSSISKSTCKTFLGITTKRKQDSESTTM